MIKPTCLFKILSDETRLRILIALYHKELCVCQLQDILEESQPKVSKHLAKLRDLNLVRDERKEQFIYYYLNDNSMLKDILNSVINSSDQYKKLKEDLLAINSVRNCEDKR